MARERNGQRQARVEVHLVETDALDLVDANACIQQGLDEDKVLSATTEPRGLVVTPDLILCGHVRSRNVRLPWPGVSAPPLALAAPAGRTPGHSPQDT